MSVEEYLQTSSEARELQSLLDETPNDSVIERLGFLIFAKKPITFDSVAGQCP